MKQQQQQQHSCKIQTKKTNDKTKKMLKEKMLRQKTSKLGAEPAPQKGQKRHRDKFSKEKKHSRITNQV